MENSKTKIRAGYQGKPDAMRENADKLMRYKEGGRVMKDDDDNKREDMDRVEKMKKGGTPKRRDSKCEKFAMGGVAKIRHGEATTQGLPKDFKKKSLKGRI